MLYKDLEIYNEMRILTQKMTLRIRDIPKEYRDTYGNNMINYCFATLKDIIRANTSLNKTARLQALSAMSTNFDMFKVYFRLALDCQILSPKAFGDMAPHISKIGKCISSWTSATNVQFENQESNAQGRL